MAPRRAASFIGPSATQPTSRPDDRSAIEPGGLPRFPRPEPDDRTRPGHGVRVAVAVSLVGLAFIGLLFRALPGVAPVDRRLAVPATAGPPPPAADLTPTPRSSAPAAAAAKAAAAKAARAEQQAEAKQKAAAKQKAEDRPDAEAEDPVKVPATGPGTYDKAETDVAAASSTGRLKRYDVRVEHGLDIDPEEAAEFIEEVLNDKRSWRGSGSWRFELVRPGESADLHAYIVTPGTTDRLCAPLRTRGEVSCQNGTKVVLNAKRWLLGVSHYGDDVINYRRYLVNHEFGHALGHQHVGCPGSGRVAPVMMQQTKGLGSCRKNPWPYPSRD